MATGYTVTDVAQRQRYTSGGTKIAYFDVAITTDRGATGTLRIDAADYQQSKIKGLLDEYSVKLDMPFTL